MPLEAPLRPLPNSLEATASDLRAAAREATAMVLRELAREATRLTAGADFIRPATRRLSLLTKLLPADAFEIFADLLPDALATLTELSDALAISGDPPPEALTLTRAVPEPSMPRLDAAALDTSMIRPAMKGPRSLIRTTTEWPLLRFSTSTLVPKGSERCAAVISLGFIISPLAVRECSAYQEACPTYSA